MKENKRISYKGYNKDEHKENIRACENPLEVFIYYKMNQGNKYYQVEQSQITKEIELKSLLEAGIEYLDKSEASANIHDSFTRLSSSGDGAKISIKGRDGRIASSGRFAQITSKGAYTYISSSGVHDIIVSSGEANRISSCGNLISIGTLGKDSKIVSCGFDDNIASFGDNTRISTNGDLAEVSSEGEHAVISCTGRQSKAKAKKGSWITLAEWVWDNGSYLPVCVKTEYVDGDRIKEDTWYRLVNGEFEEFEIV